MICHRFVSRSFWVGVIGAIALLISYFCLPHPEYERVASPDGRYVAVATYPPWAGFVPMMPGSGGDKGGWIEVLGSDGHSYGRIAVPMVSFVREIEWTPTSAHLKLVHDWSLVR